MIPNRRSSYLMMAVVVGKQLVLTHAVAVVVGKQLVLMHPAGHPKPV